MHRLRIPETMPSSPLYTDPMGVSLNVILSVQVAANACLNKMERGTTGCKSEMAIRVDALIG